MGSASFMTYHAGANMDTAYRAACAKALAEHGNDPYNGTISTTSSAVQEVYNPMTLSGARLYASVNVELGNKWEACYAIPVAADEKFTFKEVKSTIEGRTYSSRYELNQAAVEQVVTAHGDKVHDIAVVPSIVFDFEVQSPIGRGSTVFVIDGRREEYATKAAAVKAGKKLLASDSVGQMIRIKAVKSWPSTRDAVPSTRDAVRITRTTRSAKAQITATIAAPRSALAPDGWLFFGWAAI